MDLAPLQVATAGNAAVSAILAIALFYVWRLNPEERAPGAVIDDLLRTAP